MTFVELPIAGAYAVAVEPLRDERGFFARTWSRIDGGGNGRSRSWASICAVGLNAHANVE